MARQYCPTCKTTVKAERAPTSHVLHLLLTLITAGLWLPVWIIVAMSASYTCAVCGSRTRDALTQGAITSAQWLVKWGLAAVVGLFVLAFVGVFVLSWVQTWIN